MKVFYHDDMDGRCAASVVLQLDDHSIDDETCQAINYGMEFPFDIICKGERVYIVDFSIEPEDMRKLLGITEDVIWIDHHKTAIEKYSKEFKGFSGDIPGVRDVTQAGCVLTIPEYIRLIGDRDTWAWKFGARTKFFYAGLQAEDTHPLSPIWRDVATGVDPVVERGITIQDYKERTEEEYLRKNGFWVDFYGLQSYCANGMYSSEPFQAVEPDADIWMPFRYLPGGYWMVLLYTNKDIDVSEIAKRFEYHGKRGGGHKQAAGFECDYPPFLIKGETDG
jgi:oligoribonuclease NrnB/cAMP/cGMP phosphodiesterase (DHH superfamily)